MDSRCPPSNCSRPIRPARPVHLISLHLPCAHVALQLSTDVERMPKAKGGKWVICVQSLYIKENLLINFENKT